MRQLLLIGLIYALALSLDCATDKVYVKVTKQNGASYANEESHQFKDGEIILQSSPAYANNQLRSDEYCLTATSNHQYTFIIKDSYGDSWTTNSWVKIEGLYGNVIFKNYLTAPRTETYALSLYYPIMKASVWKLTSGSVGTGWNAVSFDDSAWTTVTLGSVTTAVSGTQYFRKSFTGLPSMAAYEMAFKYRYGILAYINGVSILRDNMGTGDVTSTTFASGSYSSLDFHRFLRPGAEVSVALSVLAVELHFLPTVPQTTVDFDVWIALYTPTAVDTDCYIYSDSVVLSTVSGLVPATMFDFGKNTYYNIPYASVPNTVTMNFNGPKPLLNGIRIWPSGSPVATPGSFTLQGSMTSTWNNIISITGYIYEPSTYGLFNGYFSSGLYNNYRITMTGSSISYIYAYEVQPLICSISLPTVILFTETSYSFYSKYQSVQIKPKINEWKSCSVLPVLPDGLNIDSETCVISGIHSGLTGPVTYTVTSMMDGVSYQGTFSLQFIACSGTMVKILRRYKSNSIYETYTMKDATTQQVVISVAYNSGQPTSADVTTLLCLTGNKYTITTGSSLNYWGSASFIYVYALLPGNEYEVIRSIRFDNYLGLDPVSDFNIAFSVSPATDWFYKMGEVPAGWTSSTTTGWLTASSGTFPESTNQIQMYKKTFNVASLADESGFVISLRYKYGCIVYVNEKEVFRNGVTGVLSTSSMASTLYNEVLYRKISLPIKTIAIGDTPAEVYINQGQNTIAIALISINVEQKVSVFDCSVRMMGDSAIPRVFDYSVLTSNIYGSPSQITNGYYAYNMYNTGCTTNYWSMTFNDDRREWVSSVILQLHYTQTGERVKNVLIKARNTNSEEWTTLKTVTDMSWSMVGQEKKVWIANNKPYNQYRLENFVTGDPANCAWKIGRLDFIADKMDVVIPPLSYPSTVSVYQNIEMSEIYANSIYYTDFTVTPNLPLGMTIDSQTGMISGTGIAITTSTPYAISARRVTGESVTSNINIDVTTCTGGKSLITLVARTDTLKNEASYKLFLGKTTTGTPISSIDAFKVGNGLNYGDFCIVHDIYTVQLLDSAGNGWSNPAGYYMTVDVGEMIFEMGQMPSGTSSKAVTFSSYLPFQINFDDWKMYNEQMIIDSTWNTKEYNDASWSTVKAADIGKTESMTVYLRRAVNIPNIDDYHVLNVRMRYTGGVAVYFNARQVARFNLDETFDGETPAIGLHDGTKFSKFHVILATSGGSTGANVIAFEIHRAPGVSSTVAVEFDATGVFGVSDCSIVVDTYTSITGSTLSLAQSFGELFDLSPVTYGYQVNTVGTKIEWVVENLDGSKFNSFAMQTVYALARLGFSVYGRMKTEDDYTSMVALLTQTTLAMNRKDWPIPVGIAGFKEFKYELDTVASMSNYVSSYITQYCKATGIVCDAIGDYPAVSDTQISPSVCPWGYRGYSYRTCTGGSLSEVKMDKCEFKVPASMAYRSKRYDFVRDTKITTDQPTYLNIIEEFYLEENTFLPNGLILDTKTGAIIGTPKSASDIKAYTIYGKNTAGITYTSINISIRLGECPAEGVFIKTKVGEIAEYNCAMQGSYVGSQKRGCVLGDKDGVWQQATGVCMPIIAIVLVIIVVIAIVAVAVYLIIRSNARVKAVGGVKSKKSVKGTSKKAGDKKTNMKTVKI